MAGQPVDDTIELLRFLFFLSFFLSYKPVSLIYSSFMEPGDIIVDGGNEWFPNSIRRAESLTAKGEIYPSLPLFFSFSFFFHFPFPSLFL